MTAGELVKYLTPKVIEYLPKLVTLVERMIDSGKDPDVELAALARSYEAKDAAESAWDKAKRGKFGEH